VEIDMTHCGLCHTDIHMRDNDWGISNYPMVPGHEGVGVIRKLGSCVRSAKVDLRPCPPRLLCVISAFSQRRRSRKS
jgi:uncharacterized zinc-type alcohol dehydrogenase-like protein